MTALVLMECVGVAPSLASNAKAPNIIFVIADDLGVGDLGCYGQKRIRTPYIDRLAAEGMRFRQHYSGNAVCAPSRCVLMTGLHPGHAWIRDNQEVQPEGQAPLPAGTITLARLLQRHGYTTGAFGKWGLGGPGSSGDPLRQGFDRFFGYNCQRQAHNYYPTYLWDNDRQVTLNNPPFSAHQRFPAGADAAQAASYERYQGRDYAPDRIMEQARAFIRENRDRPFFCFVPTTVPHLALQVPGDSLEEYAGTLPDEPYLGGQSYLPHPQPHAAYAAMITRLDQEVGRLVDCVRELGLEDQTLFVFTSDNGPLYDRLGGTDTDFFDSAGGLRGRKGSLYEGGVRVPCIVRWPGHVAPGTTADRVTGFEDWLPTLMELAGLEWAIPKGLDGTSFAPTLLGRRQRERPFLYREFPGYGGQQSIRVGDWKAVRQNLAPRGAGPPRPDLRTQLYQLRNDPAEARDVAAEHPRRVARLEQLMRRQHRVSRLFPLPALDELTAKP
jgi:arylsulfatase A-like enzyme